MMIKNKIFFLTAMYFLMSSLCVAQDAPLETKGPVNGWVWIGMGRDAKRMFIVGMSELQAYHFGKKDVEVDLGQGEKKNLSVYLTEFIPFNGTIADVVEWLDVFYADGANAPIPVIIALRIAAYKYAEGTDEGVEKIIQNARRQDYNF
jgi:hypothetical protein